MESAGVTAKLRSNLHRFDLVVGAEEEFHVAGGSAGTIAALRAVRAVSDAVLVCKRGPMGSVAFEGPIPDRLDEGGAEPDFPIEVFNVLGAGDGFMAGLLKGWLDGEDWPVEHVVKLDERRIDASPASRMLEAAASEGRRLIGPGMNPGFALRRRCARPSVRCR